MLAHLATTTAVLHATLVAAAATSTTAAKKTTGSSGTIILFLVVILGAGYFLYMRPRSRARLAQTQQANQRQLEVGDEVATTAGIVGRVRRIHDDRIELEIAPGMVIQVLRQNVGRPLATNVPLSDAGDNDSGDHWDQDTSALLSPGGLRDDAADEHDGDTDHSDGAEPDALPSYDGSSGRTSGSASNARGTSGAAAGRSAPASAAGSRTARSRRRPASSAPGDRPSGWSRTSDEATSSGDDDGPAGSSAAGSGS